jgi:hypothetical protein
MIDLTALPRTLRESEILRLADREAGQTFDLSRGPLLRASVLRLGAEDHAILFTVHHIVFDGWSTGVLTEEIETGYGEYLAGHRVLMAAPEIQYADFAVWERRWLTQAQLEDNLVYWREVYRDGVPPPPLSLDRARPMAARFRGSTQAVLIPQDLTDSVRALAGSEGVSLFMLLLAVISALLSRYSGLEDVVIGTPVANRMHEGLEKLIGFFANTLALRVCLSGNLTFRELLARVHHLTLEAYFHQALPAERLVEELQRSGSKVPQSLFQVMLALQNTADRPLRLPELDSTPISVHNRTSKFDLTVNVREERDGLRVEIEYDTDLFESASIRSMLDRFTLLLAAAVNCPDTYVRDLSVLTAEDAALLAEDTAIVEMDQQFLF